MALVTENPASRRVLPMPYYGYGAMRLGYWGGTYRFLKQITMRERPIIDKICLSRLNVPRILSFLREAVAE